MADLNTAALNDHMRLQDKWDARQERLERQAEEMEFDVTASEHRFKDFGFEDELATHLIGPMTRLLAKRDDAHPYNGPGGEQMELDDLAAFREHEAVWIEAEAQRLADKWIGEQ